MRLVLLVCLVLVAGCTSAEPARDPPGASDGSGSIRIAPTGEPAFSTESFVFEKRAQDATTTWTERFSVSGGAGLATSWWVENATGSLAARFVDPRGGAHELSFGPNGVEGRSSLPAMDGEWRLVVEATGWSGFVHVSAAPE